MEPFWVEPIERERVPHMRKKDRQTPRNYSRMQIFLHWAVALLVLAQLVVNDGIRLAFRDRLSDGQVAEVALELTFDAAFHLTTGLLLLALMVIRITLRLTRGAPPPPEGAPPLMTSLGEWAHRALYLLLCIMAFTGAAAWFGPSESAARLHEVTRLALVALILVHIAGALIEHYVFGNRVILRMIRFKGDVDDPNALRAEAGITPVSAAETDSSR
jgi:cytochrome b561